MVSTNISISFWQVINVAKYLFPCNAIVSYNIFRINVSVSGRYKNCRSLFFDLTVLQGILCYREFAFTVNVNYYYDFPKESMPVFKKTLGQTKSKFLSQMSRDVSFLSSSATWEEEKYFSNLQHIRKHYAIKKIWQNLWKYDVNKKKEKLGDDFFLFDYLCHIFVVFNEQSFVPAKKIFLWLVSDISLSWLLLSNSSLTEDLIRIQGLIYYLRIFIVTEFPKILDWRIKKWKFRSYNSIIPLTFIILTSHTDKTMCSIYTILRALWLIIVTQDQHLFLLFTLVVIFHHFFTLNPLEITCLLSIHHREANYEKYQRLKYVVKTKHNCTIGKLNTD